MDFALFDARRYETLTVPEGYGLWAQSYDRTVESRMDLELLGRLGSVDWASVQAAADLACGSGRIGQWLRDRGALAVDGVDLTGPMLEQARSRGVYRRLERADMTACPLEGGAYDLVTNVLAVEHLPRLEPLYREAARLARPQGRFVLLGYHPHFLLNGIPTHFNPQPGASVAIRNYVHLFSDHIRAARAEGWRLEDLDERVVDQAWVEQTPHWKKYAFRPVSFVLVWARQPGSPDRAGA